MPALNRFSPLALLNWLRVQPAARRLFSGTAANLFDKVSLLAVQLVSIPILTRAWGVDGYGIWLILLTIPTYVALSDFGLGTAAGVDITKKVALGDHRGALEAFQSVWAFVTGVVFVIGLLACGYAAHTYFSAPAVGGPFEGRSLGTAILFITLYAIVVVQMSILTVIFRATHKYALAMTIAAGMILAEGAALLIVCLMGGAIVEAAIALLAVRLVGHIGFCLLLLRMEPWVHLGISNATIATFKRLANPSMAALSLTLSSAVALQGMLLVLGWVAGPASVAAFGAARVLTRIPLQLSGLTMRASIPELTRAQVAGNYRLTRRLRNLNVASALLVTVPFSIVLFIFGPQLLHIMSDGRLDAPLALFVFLTLAATLNAAWTALASPMIAMNEHWRFAYWALALSAVATATPLLASGNQPIIVAAIAMALAETVTLAIIIAKSKGQIDYSSMDVAK